VSPRAWRPALRLARRDLWRHKVRAALTFLLVALPVFVAAIVAVTVHNGSGDGESYAAEQMGDADALVRVSPWTKVRVRDAMYGVAVPPSGKARQRRDPATVDLPSLLPAGSRVVPGPEQGPLELATGGVAFARVVPEAAVAEPMARAVSGRLPSASDEVAVGHGAAKLLGLLDESGEPKDEATLGLADGSELAVVGTVSVGGPYLSVVGRPGLPLAPEPEDDEGPTFLVSLPELTTPQLKALVRTLAADGVSVQPRDAILHPERWGQGGPGVDAESVYAGSLAILVGLVEVVLVVGAAFAVAGRRQLRDLGLVAANGGVGRDVRRVMLAQGVVLGITASVVGAGLGTALGMAGGSWAERRFDLVRYSSEVPWLAIAAVTALGALTAVVAALVPAWSLGRLTPVQALSGRFPVRLRTARPHTGSFALAGFGLLVLLVGGYLTSRWFAPRAGESPLGPFISAIGLLLLLAGVVWATPYLVQVAAASGRALPLSGRYAFRAAGRHRFRTAAATTALTFTVAVAVLTGFGVSAAADSAGTGVNGTRGVLTVDGGLEGAEEARVRATLEDTLGSVTLVSSRLLGRGMDQVLTARANGGWPEVRLIDRASLEALQGPLTAAEAAAFESGSLLLTDRSGVPSHRDRLRIGLEGDRDAAWVLPVVRLGKPRVAAGEGGVGQAFVSAATAQRLDVRPSYTSYVAVADRAITDADLQRLNAYGISAWSYDPDRTQVERYRYAGVLGAGLLSLLVVGIAVALAAAEGRDEAATLTAVGAGPGRRRAIGAMHGLFIGLTGTVLGVLVGLPGALAFVQMDGLARVDVPWLSFLGTLVAVTLLSPVAGWLVTPSRLPLTRRVG
jgi:putative ABC transport system permease protein